MTQDPHSPTHSQASSETSTAIVDDDIPAGAMKIPYPEGTKMPGDLPEGVGATAPAADTAKPAKPDIFSGFNELLKQNIALKQNMDQLVKLGSDIYVASGKVTTDVVSTLDGSKAKETVRRNSAATSLQAAMRGKVAREEVRAVALAAEKPPPTFLCIPLSVFCIPVEKPAIEA